MARNPDFLHCKGERKQESFFKVLQGAGITSENMRALPYDLVRNFSDNDLSRKLEIRAQWGRSWEVGISKNPRFFFMEKSGWKKFVKDNALGDNEFLTFTHKGNMLFNVNIFKEDGKEMMQPPAFLASSSRVKTEQDVKKEEVVVASELSSRGPKTGAESNGGGMFKRKLNTGKKKAEESTNYKRTEKEVFSGRRNTAGASSSSSSVAEFTIYISKSYIKFLVVPMSFAKNMPRERTMFKIHHPDGNKSWNVAYLPSNYLCAGWRRLIREYPLSVGTTCKFTLIKPNELLLVVPEP